jgi:hypothetical protein
MAKCLALRGQRVGFALLFADNCCGMGDVAVCFKTAKKGVDKAGAYVFLEVVLELGYDLVTVYGTFAEYHQDVEAVKVAK